jgi:hypothetical protein
MMDKAILIDSSLDYEITLQVKGDALFTFGIIGFDENNVKIDLTDITTLLTKNLFFNKLELPQNDRWYFIRGILYNYNQIQLSTIDGIMECGLGNNLRLPENCKFVVPYLVNDNNLNGGVSGDLYLWNMKIRPLNFEQEVCGCINLKNLIYSFMKNNSGNDDDVITENMRRKLVPYNTSIINKFI